MPVTLRNIPQDVSTIYLHTGNMLCFSSLINQVHLKNTEQITESLKICLSNMDRLPEVIDNTLHIKFIDLVSQTDEEKESLQTSVKVFISSDELNTISEALDYTLKDLNFSEINTVILAYNHKETNRENLTSNLLYLWKNMERFVKDGVVSTLGISDIDLIAFRELFNNAEVKPTVMQIKLDMCCVVPTDMQHFCRDNNVRILTHNDPTDILPIDLLKDFFSNEDGEICSQFRRLRVSWVTRLLSHIRGRGILSNKGYIMGLTI